MPLFYGRLLGLPPHHIPHQAVPEVDREAREDRPLERVEQVEQVELHLARRRGRVDRFETRPRVVEHQVPTVGGYSVWPDVDELGDRQRAALARLEVGLRGRLARQVTAGERPHPRWGAL